MNWNICLNKWKDGFAQHVEKENCTSDSFGIDVTNLFYKFGSGRNK